MSARKMLKYCALGLLVFLAGLGISLAVAVYALTPTERRGVLYTTSFTLGGQEQVFKAFYLSAPAESFEIAFNVSNGSVKFSPWLASQFEKSLGWFDYYVNETTVEKRQVWFFEGKNGTAGCCGDSVNQVWYIQFYNEDPYEKEVRIQITKIWHISSYQSWMQR